MQRTTIPDAEIRNTDPETLIYCFTPWVQKIASRYSALLDKTGAVDMDDLYQAGFMGLLKAQQLYDPEAVLISQRPVYLLHLRYLSHNFLPLYAFSLMTRQTPASV